MGSKLGGQQTSSDTLLVCEDMRATKENHFEARTQTLQNQRPITNMLLLFIMQCIKLIIRKMNKTPNEA